MSYNYPDWLSGYPLYSRYPSPLVRDSLRPDMLNLDYSRLTSEIEKIMINGVDYRNDMKGNTIMLDKQIATQVFPSFTKALRAGVDISPDFADFHKLLIERDVKYREAVASGNTVYAPCFEDACTEAVRSQKAKNFFMLSVRPDEIIIKRRVYTAGSVYTDRMVAEITSPDTDHVQFKLFLYAEDNRKGWVIAPAS